MRNTHSRSKSKYIRSPRKLISSKAQESGYHTERHIMRCITRRKPTLPRPHWYTAQVAVWARRRSKSPAPRRASIRAFTLWGITAVEEADIHAGLFAGLENGTLRPVVGKEIPLAEAARAHKEILEPGSAGKIVLIC